MKMGLKLIVKKIATIQADNENKSTLRIDLRLENTGERMEMKFLPKNVSKINRVYLNL